MTTSPRPWTLKIQIQEPPEKGLQTAQLLDSLGNPVAVFKDHRDAEYVLQILSYQPVNDSRGDLNENPFI